MTASLIQEGLAIKAERMKKKLTGGKKKVEIDEIKVKNFVLFSTVGRYEEKMAIPKIPKILTSHSLQNTDNVQNTSSSGD